MCPEPVSIRHLDYLRRAGATPSLADAGAAPIVPHDVRRMLHIRSIGRPKERNGSLNRRSPKARTDELLVSAYGRKIPVAFLVSSDALGASFSLGTWVPESASSVRMHLDRRIGALQSVLQSGYPAIDVTPADPSIPSHPFGGIVLGVPSPNQVDLQDGASPMDRLVRSLFGMNWAALVLAEPLAEAEITRLRDSALHELREVESSFKATLAPDPVAERYIELLRGHARSLLTGDGTGAWRTAVYLLGDSQGIHHLTAIWRGLFSGTRSIPEPVRVWSDKKRSEAIVHLARDWAMPYAPGSMPPGRYRHPFEHQTLLTSSHLAAYVHLPNLEIPGFGVRMVADFDTEPPRTGRGQSVTIGKVFSRGNRTIVDYAVDAHTLNRHTFIAGVTGSGKTNTTFHLLGQLIEQNVPFLVLEPAKREYRDLLTHLPQTSNVHIFTPGNELLSPIRLNPFEVPPGTPVAVHIDLLRSVFAASFGMWTPLPQILERCLHAIYKDKGWEIARDANPRLGDDPDRSRAFPTLADLSASVDHVIGQLGYDARIADDMRAALLTRIEGLRTGGKGAMLDTRRSVPMSLLLDHPTVIELEGLGDDDDKAFVMALLLLRLVEHRRAAGPANGVIHALVIEEAHRLLANVAVHARQEDANPRGKAVETFSNLLSEIRAYGQGVFIADQVPVKLAPDVIKNTNLKIIHRLLAADDRNAVAGAMAMDEEQSHVLSSLPVGRAAVFGEGADGAVLVDVPLAFSNDAASAKPTQSGRTSDYHVRNQMASRPALAHLRNGLLPLPACGETCVDSPQACEFARHLVSRKPFQRQFARLIQSEIEDATAITRLWPQLIASFSGDVPRHLDRDRILPSLATHAAEWFASHRGAHAGWSFHDTEALAHAIRRMLLAEISNTRTQEPRDRFQALMRRLSERSFDPFPACDLICTQHPPACLYRFAASDLAAHRDIQHLWLGAETDDLSMPGTGRKRTLNACIEAASDLIELADPAWEAGDRDRSDASARRAALCFGQQMLMRGATRDANRIRIVAQQLISEGQGS